MNLFTVLVMGSILGCRAAALAMAAGISLGRSVFLRIENAVSKSKVGGSQSIEDAKQENIVKRRDALANEAGRSDHACMAFIFLKWQATETGLRNQFCESLGISSNVLRDICQLFNQLNYSLVDAGFTSTPASDRYNSSWRVIQTCVVASMSPNQLVKVRRPATKYHETAEGAKEIDGLAKELAFFIRGSLDKEERVFIHPSSINFAKGNYGCPFLVYNSMVRTSKPFLRDVTECSAYALLLFGGELQIQASKDTVVVDNWAELSANARIGSLIGGLRKRIDSLLAKKIVNPVIDASSFPEMKLVIKLIRTEGLGL
jgi:ATP-dependent RNA helicase DHX57